MPAVPATGRGKRKPAALSPLQRKRSAGAPQSITTKAEKALFRQLVVDHSSHANRNTSQFKERDWQQIACSFNKAAEEQAQTCLQSHQVRQCNEWPVHGI